MSSSVLSAKVAAKLNARIKELLNDGLSDSEIVRAIRREANTTRAWPEMSFARIKKLIDVAMDDEESASATSAPTFDSDEEDEEYVPEASDEESDEEYVPEESESEASDSETSDGHSGDSSASSDESAEELTSAIFYFDNSHGEIDRLTISRGDGTFNVEMAYNLKDHRDFPRRANFFEGDIDAVHLYVADLLRLIALDELPFRSVEFAIPFFPSFSLRPKTLRKKANRKLVEAALLQFLEHFA